MRCDAGAGRVLCDRLCAALGMSRRSVGRSIRFSGGRESSDFFPRLPPYPWLYAAGAGSEGKTSQPVSVEGKWDLHRGSSSRGAGRLPLSLYWLERSGIVVAGAALLPARCCGTYCDICRSTCPVGRYL